MYNPAKAKIIQTHYQSTLDRSTCEKNTNQNRKPYHSYGRTQKQLGMKWEQFAHFHPKKAVQNSAHFQREKERERDVKSNETTAINELNSVHKNGSD